MLSWLLRMFGVLLMLSAIAAQWARAPDRSPDSLVARWAPRPSDFIEVQGQLVHLRDEGPRHDPQPVLLLHGLAGSLHDWNGWATPLRGQRRVVRLDLPGAGLTGPVPGPGHPDDYSGDALARFVLATMDTLKLQRVTVVGHSLGGEVAWRLASMAPERVGRLVLLDAGGLPAPQGETPLGVRLAGLPVVGWLGDHVLPRPVVELSLQDLYADPRRIGPELVDRHFELLLREGNRRALRLLLQRQRPGEDADRLAQLRVPTLVLWGERDRVLPPSVGAEFAHRIPGAKLQVFQNLGHLPHEEDPPRTVKALQEFLGPR